MKPDKFIRKNIGNMAKKSSWSIQKSLDLYRIKEWGESYFGINKKGNFCVYPFGDTKGPSIDLLDVVDEIHDKKLSLPCIVRFQDVLRSRVEVLCQTFEAQIKKWKYKSKYYGVYPIKVNQMREVVEEVLDAGSPHHFGLEAGSKGELLSVLAYNEDPQALTICNGYKDEDYLRLALLGRKLDRKVIVVIEKLSELPQILSLAKEMKVQAYVGLRARLSTQGAGKWVSSSGDYAKFGLTVPEIMMAVDILKREGQEEALRLFHFHVGSQLTNIRTIKEAVTEGSRIYAKLKKMGFPIDYFDVGGGLGVDYDGSHSTSESSINYSLEEYAADVVYNLKQICENEDVPEPHIVSESGRAITAHHSCIIMPVFGAIKLGRSSSDSSLFDKRKDEAEIVSEMREIVSGLNSKNIQETYHDAAEKKQDALSMFKYGLLSLQDRAQVESYYWQLCRDIVETFSDKEDYPEELEVLQTKMADQYLANFSLFQSAPDHWAFEQLFPIVPLQRHKEEPSQSSTVVDITCDSDGKISCFLGESKRQKTIPLHPLKKKQPYYLGLFLLGAYQDIMGDMHNLFGRVNEVHVFCDDDDPEDFYLEEVIPGDQHADVLLRLQYHPSEMNKFIKKAIDKKVKSGLIKPKEGVKLVDFYEDAMKHYTYLKTS